MKETPGGVLHRLDEVIQRNPSTIIMMVGTNDIAEGKPEEDIVECATMVLTKLHESLPDARIILCSVLPSPQLDIRVVKELNTLLERETQNISNIVYLNLFDAFTLDNDMPNQNLFSEDGIHLNGDGYNIWIESLRTLLQ